MRFSARTDWSTETNALSKLAADFRAAGTPFLDLTVSNPAQCGFKYFNPGLLEGFSRKENLSYHPDPRGLEEAREVILQYYKRKGILLSREQIFVTANTSEAYSSIFRLLFETGETLLAPQPSYPLLDYLAALHDLKVARYPLTADGNWKIRIGNFLENARALLAVNYNNPTGSGLNSEDLRLINRYCKQYSMALISDEVFLDYPLTEEARKTTLSTASNEECLTFTLSGISKILGLPQMKISWIAVTGPEAERREAVHRLEIISDTYLSASTPSQNALKHWFQSEAVIQKEILERVRENYEFLRGIISEKLKLIPVQGGWHAPLLMPESKSDDAWALELLSESKVFTHPGYLFDFEENHFLVLSLLIPQEIFQEGVRRIVKASA